MAACGLCSGARCRVHRDPLAGAVVALAALEWDDGAVLRPTVLACWDGDPIPADDRYDGDRGLIWIMSGHAFISIPAEEFEAVAIRAAMVADAPPGTSGHISHFDDDGDGGVPDDLFVHATRMGEQVRIAQGSDFVWLDVAEVDVLFRAVFWIVAAQMQMQAGLQEDERRDLLGG